MRDESWCIVDTETTGLYSPICAVEIAAQRMRDGSGMVNPFVFLLNHDVPIEPAAEALHGYSREYGDKYPTTSEGRLIAMVLMLSGVGLFGTLSGIVASFFLGTDDKSELREVLDRLNVLETRLQARPPELVDGKSTLTSSPSVSISTFSEQNQRQN